MKINQPHITDAEELCIAINPTNPDVLAVGANISHFFRSTDGGEVWSHAYLSSTLGVAGDPCLVFDSSGNLYNSHLSLPQGGSWLDRIVVQKSTDSGMTWSNGVGVGHNPPKDQDKSWLAADSTNSPWRDNLYLAWTEFDVYGSGSSTDSTRILFSRSTNQSTSWSPPIRISDQGGNCIDDDETVEGATPTVGPAGQVYLAWSAHESIYFDRSFDGGQSFGQDSIISSQPGGWAFNVPGVYRCNGMPITVCDTSHSSFRGRIYVVFSDQRNGNDNTDVFLVFSDDEGTTWSSPTRVNDDQGNSHQFFPWLSVDPITGTVSVVFYDRRDTQGNATDVTVAVSNDGGISFANIPVSESSFTPWSSVFFGDYIGIDSFDGTIQTTWMSMDEGDLSVWLAKLTFISGLDPEHQENGVRVEQSVVMKVPSTTGSQQTRIAFTTYHNGPVNLSVYDLRGHRVQSLVSEHRPAGSYSEMWDGSNSRSQRVSSGMYLIRLQAGSETVTRKVVINN